MAFQHRPSAFGTEKGIALLFIAVVMVVLLLAAGLCIDAGRAYLVKAQLSKAVDAAALGAAKVLNSGDPRTEAEAIFKANFGPSYMGVTTPDPTTAPDFYTLTTDPDLAVNTVRIRASVLMPTTLMRLGNITDVTVNSVGEATRRMVDLSLVLDVSSSIGGKWGAVRDATRQFIDAFDETNDRMSLVQFGNGAKVMVPMTANRGFNKANTETAVANNLPGGSTPMAEGLYRGWDELRTVPRGQQSTLRVIVLFTDGASNSVPGFYDGTTAKGLRTSDFPKNFPDPDGQTMNDPRIAGLFDTESGVTSPPYNLTTTFWNSTETLAKVPLLPLTSAHTHSRSSGIPTAFPLQVDYLNVNGVAQSVARGLRNIDGGTGQYPADVWNVNNAARNLVEIIANEARNDDGDYRIRIFTIGMGELVRYDLGTMPEKPEQILMRIANEHDSLDYNSAQLAGRYYYAATAADVGPAFQALQNQIIRLSR